MRSIPKRDECGYALELDNTELETYAHNPRCYFWEHVMGLVPSTGQPDDMVVEVVPNAPLIFGGAFHLWLENWYDGKSPEESYDLTIAEFGDLLGALEMAGDYRTAGRLQIVIDEYLHDDERIEMDRPFRTLHVEQYVVRPIDGIIAHGGKIDMVRIDERDNTVTILDHKTSKKKVKSDYYMDWFNYSNQITGYSWHGHHLTGLMREQGVIPDDSQFVGCVINAVQTSPLIQYSHARSLFVRSEEQVREFVANAWEIGHEILRRKEATDRLLEAGDPPELAWTHWPTYGEMFCKWKEVNKLEPSYRQALLESYQFDPWWVRRRSKLEV